MKITTKMWEQMLTPSPNAQPLQAYYDYDTARKLYDDGKMPHWIFAQLYARPDEVIELYEKEKKRKFAELEKEMAERRAQEQAKRDEARAQKELEKEIESQAQQAVEKAVADLLKPLSKIGK